MEADEVRLAYEVRVVRLLELGYGIWTMKHRLPDPMGAWCGIWTMKLRLPDPMGTWYGKWSLGCQIY